MRLIGRNDVSAWKYSIWAKITCENNVVSYNKSPVYGTLYTYWQTIIQQHVAKAWTSRDLGLWLVTLILAPWWCQLVMKRLCHTLSSDDACVSEVFLHYHEQIRSYRWDENIFACTWVRMEPIPCHDICLPFDGCVKNRALTLFYK